MKNNDLKALLILSVTLVLLVMLDRDRQGLLAMIASIITLTTLILAFFGETDKLSKVLDIFFKGLKNFIPTVHINLFHNNQLQGKEDSSKLIEDKNLNSPKT